LQVDSKVKNNTPQLTLLGSMDSSKRAPAQALAPAAPATPVAAAPATTPVTPPTPAPAPATDAAKVATVAPVVASQSATAAAAPASTKPIAAAAVTPAPAAPAVAAPKPEPKKEDAQQKQAKADSTDIRNAVLAWAKAWSQKDMNRYLGAYASSFTPPDKMSRAKWESDRRARIVSKKTISVDVNNFKVEATGNKATARFQQIYESDNFKGNSHKTLELVKQGDHWLITRETVN